MQNFFHLIDSKDENKFSRRLG